MRTYDFSPLFAQTVGFDRIERMLDAAMRRSESAQTYPPYNIEAVGEDAYRITMAVAGFREDDLDVTVTDNVLTVSGRIEDGEERVNYLHRGIATRAFQRTFDLADHVKVDGANLVNGILTIDLVREIPDELKPRKIEIKHGGVAALAQKAKKLIGGEEHKAA